MCIREQGGNASGAGVGVAEPSDLSWGFDNSSAQRSYVLVRISIAYVLISSICLEYVYDPISFGL